MVVLGCHAAVGLEVQSAASPRHAPHAPGGLYSRASSRTCSGEAYQPSFSRTAEAMGGSNRVH